MLYGITISVKLNARQDRWLFRQAFLSRTRSKGEVVRKLIEAAMQAAKKKEEPA